MNHSPAETKSVQPYDLFASPVSTTSTEPIESSKSNEKHGQSRQQSSGKKETLLVPPNIGEAGGFHPTSLKFAEDLLDSKSVASIAATETDKVPQRLNNYTSAELQLHSWNCLGRTYPGFSKTYVIAYQISSKVFGPLQGWLSSSENRALWLYGPSKSASPSELTLTSGYVVTIISNAMLYQDAGLHMLTHRCRTEQSAMESLVSMVHSLIVQLAGSCPEIFHE